MTQPKSITRSQTYLDILHESFHSDTDNIIIIIIISSSSSSSIEHCGADVKVKTRKLNYKLLLASRSQILSDPESDPAATTSSSRPKQTASTGLEWPDRLFNSQPNHKSEFFKCLLWSSTLSNAHKTNNAYAVKSEIQYIADKIITLN